VRLSKTEFRKKYFSAALAADVVIYINSQDQFLLIRRKNEPFKGKLAFPGGFLEPDEDFKDAALRELKEETAVQVNLNDLVTLGIYSKPNRDPRGRVVTVAFLVILENPVEFKACDDAKEADLYKTQLLYDMKSDFAFDHFNIFQDALLKVKAIK